MSHDFWVTIHGERGAEWERVIGTNCLPVQSPVPIPALLPGLGESLVFLLAMDQLEPEQVMKIVEHLSAKFRLSPEEAAQEIAAAGIPILHTDCSIMIHNPQKWC